VKLSFSPVSMMSKKAHAAKETQREGWHASGPAAERLYALLPGGRGRRPVPARIRIKKETMRLEDGFSGHRTGLWKVIERKGKDRNSMIGE